MQHIKSLHEITLKDSWVTIGAFDGVHLGHRQILKELTAGAHENKAPAVVLTFYPHPETILHGPRDSFYLSSLEEKVALLEEFGPDYVITYPFNQEVASQSASQFMTNLNHHLGIDQLWVGYDFALGHNREGDVANLRILGEQLGFYVHEVSPFSHDGNIVSSSLIRNLLTKGDVEDTAKLLGRPYRLSGKVVHGEGRGKTIGIPTANLSVWKERAVPGSGVYVCRVIFQGKIWGGVTNIGVRPTFKTETMVPTIETHILDFDQDIYDQEIQLEFLIRLRGEKKFSGVDELVKQIQADIKEAREILADIK